MLGVKTEHTNVLLVRTSIMSFCVLQFPWLLDMAPYTAEGIAQLDEGKEVTEQRLYELVGIVVHSGQASAGHYYAFVKEKRFVHVCITV